MQYLPFSTSSPSGRSVALDVRYFGELVTFEGIAFRLLEYSKSPRNRPDRQRPLIRCTGITSYKYKRRM